VARCSLQHGRSPLERAASLTATVLLGLAAAATADGAAARRGSEPYSYVAQTWQAEDGLPQNSVLAIAQGRDGYLWLGTQEGLVRFDGVAFTLFDKQNTPALRSSFVITLLEDRAGTLWIGTSRGLARLDRGAFTAVELGPDGKEVVASLLEDTRGRLWVGTDAGLVQLDHGRVAARLTVRDGLAHDTIRGLGEDRRGRLWVGTHGGVSVLEDGRWRRYGTAEGLPDDQVRALHADRGGQVWLGTARGGLARLAGDRFVEEPRAEWPGGLVSAFFEDRAGALWIATTRGLVRYGDGRFDLRTRQQGLSDDRVLAVAQDREGNLWVGTDRGGLNRLRDPGLVTYAAEDGLPVSNVLSLLEDRQGAMWIGTYGGGLVASGPGGFRTFGTRQGLVSADVTALAEARQGGLWVGHLGGGLSHFRDGRAVAVPLGGAAPPPVLSLREGSDGGLWVGTARGGLLRLQDGVVARYGKREGLPDETVFCILERRDRSLWVGTREGMARWSGTGFVAERREPGQAPDSVLTLFEDGDGVLWAGTYGGGLARQKDGRWTTFTTRQGLFNDTVFQVLDDGQGHLWMSSNRGISRVDKAELDEVASGRRAQVQATVFGRGDGMRSVECNGASQPGAWRTRDGLLWFATAAGAVRIDPAHLPRNTLPPPVVLEQVLLARRPLALAADRRVPPSRGDFEFRYTALSFVAPEKVHFRYRLEGFDEDWVEAGAARSAAYTNLPPGAYRFRVIASNNDGVWNESGAAFDFELLPFFHQTRWFRALPVLGLGLAGWGFHLWRTRRLAAQWAVLAERTRMAGELHDSLAQGLTGMVLQLEAADAVLPPSAPDARQRLEQARRLAQSSLAEARRCVRALRPEALQKAELPEALSRMAAQLVSDTGIAVEVKVVGGRQPLPAEAEGQLFRVGQEALTNAVRHGRPGHISLELAYDEHAVRLRITDDGRGFIVTERAPGSGFGLVGMRERIESLGGRLQLTSQPGAGTDVAAVVPLRPGAHAPAVS
jgi:ligand-binding sensor domain-containing protein/signal transduction histidine kinase